MECKVVGLAHLHALLEKVVAGVDRAAVKECRPSELQDVGAARRIYAPLRELERLLDVSFDLLVGREPRKNPRQGSM
jgi:hypothetical protein